MSELAQTIDFPQKAPFLKACQDLNSLRIDTVHRLTGQGGVENLLSKLDSSASLFQRLHDLHRDIVSYFIRGFDRRADVILASLKKTEIT
jgi:hypothetical protein